MGMDSKNSSDKKWLPLKLGDGKIDKKNNKLLFLVVAAVIGAALMAASDMWNKKNQAVTTTVQPPSQKDVETFAADKKTKPKNIQDYETQYENQLKEALDEMLGVNNVTVVVNVEATEKKVLEKNTKTQKQTTEEKDKQGGKRTIQDETKEEDVVMVQKGDTDEPLVVETMKPKIRGVLVVAEGAENIEVKKWIIEAVTRVLDVPSYRVAVMPKK
ncbi:stage III sporulation protein AG [Bacillus smithii]|uniref:stage III sporulation protein AG n=1 Tax=Bacillus smithii TaxID=1479 RepID=UPI0030C9BFB1